MDKLRSCDEFYQAPSFPFSTLGEPGNEVTPGVVDIKLCMQSTIRSQLSTYLTAQQYVIITISMMKMVGYTIV